MPLEKNLALANLLAQRENPEFKSLPSTGT